MVVTFNAANAIQAGTITAALILANTITAGQIAAGTITSAQIAATTITAGNIVSGTITATQLAANSVTATQLAANSVTAGAILAGTIVAADIAANTITGGKIAATTITAANIAASTITATQLATGIVYATIVDGTTITGSQIVADGTSGNFLVYAGTPAAGNLFFAVSPSGGADGFSNPYNQGCTFIGISGLTSVLTVTDPTGLNKIAGIDSTGNVSGQVINAATDLQIAGVSVVSTLSSAALGVVTQGILVPPLPSSGSFTSATEYALFELDAQLPGGRVYSVSVTQVNVHSGTAGARITLYLKFTTDGSTPSTSSGIGTEASAWAGTANVNYSVGPIEGVFSPGSLTTYRFLVTGIGTANWNIQGEDVVMSIQDIGAATGNNTNNNLLVLGTGTGGGASKQNYTEVFYPSATHSYYSNSGLRNTNGDMYHGAYSGESPNYQFSYIAWAAGSLGGTLSTILGYTINWATLRLTNLHSWYDSGMTAGLHNSTSLGGGVGTYGTLMNTGGWFISEGNTYAFSLNSSMWGTLFQQATYYTVLGPDAGDETNLSWYGYFYGGGGVDSSMPCIEVSFTH